MAERTLEDRIGKDNAAIFRAVGKALGWTDREFQAWIRTVGKGAKQVGDEFVWLLEEVLAKAGPVVAQVMYNATKDGLHPETRARADEIMARPVPTAQEARDRRAAEREGRAAAAPGRHPAPESFAAERGGYGEVAARPSRPGLEGVAGGPSRQAFIAEAIAAGMSPEDAAEAAEFAAARGLFEDEIAAPPIGVPEDLDFAQTPEALATMGRAGVEPRRRKPLYHEGAEGRPFGWSSEEIAGLQRKLVQAGLLPGEFRQGWYDSATQAAYRGALGFANQRGVGVNEALDLLAGQREEEKERLRQQFQAEAFRPPDDASLSQRAQDAFVAMGRRRGEWTDAEMEHMKRLQSGAFQAEHAAEQEVARRQFEAEMANIDRMPSDPVAQADLAGIERVDPQARFNEAFQEHYGGELLTRDTAEKVAGRGIGAPSMQAQVARGGV